MHSFNKFVFSALLAFLLIIIPIASAVSYFSQDWSYPTYDDTPIPQHALVSIGQTAYFGSSIVPSPTNYLYAVNITNGQRKWQYNTSLPINVLSNFEYKGNESVVVGTGDDSAPSEGNVIAISQNNKTLWQWPKLPSHATPYVTSLSSADSNLANTEDVVAGLQNGTVIRLSGNNGTVQWQYNCIGIVNDIVPFNNASVIVGTSSLSTHQGYIYCLEKNGTPRWPSSYYTAGPSYPLTLVKRFGDVDNGTPEVVATFEDGLIHVLNGTTGKEITPWPFHVGDIVVDLLCANYTKDGFPDIMAGTENGSLMIIGRNATLFQGPVQISSITLSYLQYMNFYENGNTYVNKTLAVSIQNSTNTFYIVGVNATDLTIMNRYQVSSTARNLINVGNYTSSFTGDLLFSVDYTAYDISGTSIITPEFPSQIMLVFLILTMWLLIAILGRGRSRIR